MNILHSARLETSVPDKVWVELYEPAVDKKNDMTDDAWFWSRKYQALFREERINKVITFDFKDADEQPQNFTLLFVDHTPTKETIDAFEQTLKRAAFMRNGRLADRVNAIAIYSTENAGLADPKKIGLGIDDEYAKNVLGLVIPALSLAEIHMPPKPTQDELERYNGAVWVLAHEVPGHLSSSTQNPVKATRVAGRQTHLQNYVTSNPWLGVSEAHYRASGRRRLFGIEARQFAIEQLREVDDTTLTEEFIVTGNDPRLAEAEWVRIRNLPATNYAEQDREEFHAEAVAQAITGIQIPFEEAGIYPFTRISSDSEDSSSSSSSSEEVVPFKSSGYAIDASQLNSLVSIAGSLDNTDHFEWTPEEWAKLEASWKRKGYSVNSFKRTRDLSETSKHTPYQSEEKRLRFLADATE